MTSSSVIPSEPPAARVGWDWGDSNHALALQPDDSSKVELLTLPHSAESVHQWLDELEQRFGGRPVDFALEGTKGPAFSLLQQRSWARVYGVHPATTARYRSAFVPSGAKDDRPDALLLLELLTRHVDRLRLLIQPDPATGQLDELTRLRRDMVDRRTQLTNQLESLLKSFYPQARILVGSFLHSPLALDFLRRWPSLVELKKVRPATLRSFYHRHNVRSSAVLEERLQLVQQARFLVTDPGLITVRTLQLASLVDQLEAIQSNLLKVEEAIQEAFDRHPEASLFRHLPGAGAALAPRLLALFGSDRGRWQSPADLQRLCGVAPVMERSGNSSVTHFRWQAPKFQRQTLVEWAKCSIKSSAWAKDYYDRMKAKGKGSWTIFRALAFKWLRILWKCWHSKTPYDEARHLAHLTARARLIPASK